MSSVNIPAEDSTDERQEVIQVQILPQVGTTLASESYLHSYPWPTEYPTERMLLL